MQVKVDGKLYEVRNEEEIPALLSSLSSRQEPSQTPSVISGKNIQPLSRPWDASITNDTVPRNRPVGEYAGGIQGSPLNPPAIGPASSPVREAPTVTASDALTKYTAEGRSPFSGTMEKLIPPLAGMNKLDQVARAAVAGPGMEYPGPNSSVPPTSSQGEYKTRGAKVIDALMGKSNVTPSDVAKTLKDTGYISKTAEADFQNLPQIAQEVLTSPSGLFIPSFSKAAPVTEVVAPTVSKQAIKSELKTLKKISQEVTEKVNELDFLKPINTLTGGDGIPPLKVIAPEAKTIGKTRIALSATAESPRQFLSKLGKEGQALVKKFENVRFEEASKLGAAENDIIKFIKPLTPNEKDNFVDVFKHGVKPINERVEAAYKAIQPRLTEIKTQAIKKLPNFKPIEENYWPIIRTDEALEVFYKQNKGLYDEALTKVRNGEELSLADATESLLRGDKYKSAQGYRPNSNLDFQRTTGNEEDIIKEPEVLLSKYFRGAYRRLAEADQYGLADKKVEYLINNIRNSFGDDAGEYVSDVFKSVIGDYKLLSQTERNVSNMVRNVQTVTKLGLAQITNVGQSANTAIRTNFAATAGGLKDLMTQEGKEFAREAGAFADTIADELAGSGTVGQTFLKTIGFKQTEWANRGIAALAGRRYALSNFDKLFKAVNEAGLVKATKKGFKLVKGAESELPKLKGFSNLKELVDDIPGALKQGFLSQEAQKKAAFRVVKDTQFATHAEDLPLLWQSPTGKVLTQFKSFAFQHSKFMKDAVLKKAASGDMRPLLRTVFASATIGELVNDTKETVKSGFTKNEFASLIADVKKASTGNVSPLLHRQLDNFFQLGAFGLYSDLIKSSTFGKESVAKAFLGPTGSDIVDFASPVLEAAAPLIKGQLPTTEKLKETGKDLGKQILRRAPIIGTPLKNILFERQAASKEKKKPKRLFMGNP